jgi:hypothetical protein
MHLSVAEKSGVTKLQTHTSRCGQAGRDIARSPYRRQRQNTERAESTEGTACAPVPSVLLQPVLSSHFVAASVFRPEQVDEAKDTSPHDEANEGIAQEQLPQSRSNSYDENANSP